MSTAPSAQPSFLERHHFLIRRLHSLSGIVPVGVFLVMHLSTNASVLVGADAFQKNVEKINDLPLLPVIELLFIFLPITFHAALGVVIWRTADSNVQSYRYGGNIRYTLQRVTGMIALVFIIFHVGTMHRWGLEWFHVTDPVTGEPAAVRTTAEGITRWAFLPAFYAVGILSSVYHLANGVWTTLITWGITVGPNAQRKAGYACAVFGVLLGLVGLAALRGFTGTDRGSTAVAAPAADATALADP